MAAESKKFGPSLLSAGEGLNHTFQRDQFEQMLARGLVGIQKGGLNRKVPFSICAESPNLKSRLCRLQPEKQEL
jgi:hypothetical protein